MWIRLTIRTLLTICMYNAFERTINVKANTKSVAACASNRKHQSSSTPMQRPLLTLKIMLFLLNSVLQMLPRRLSYGANIASELDFLCVVISVLTWLTATWVRVMDGKYIYENVYALGTNRSHKFPACLVFCCNFLACCVEQLEIIYRIRPFRDTVFIMET